MGDVGGEVETLTCPNLSLSRTRVRFPLVAKPNSSPSCKYMRCEPPPGFTSVKKGCIRLLLVFLTRDYIFASHLRNWMSTLSLALVTTSSWFEDSSMKKSTIFASRAFFFRFKVDMEGSTLLFSSFFPLHAYPSTQIHCTLCLIFLKMVSMGEQVGQGGFSEGRSVSHELQFLPSGLEHLHNTTRCKPLGSRSLQRKGVNPLQLRKTSEIRISRRQIASVFYCRCSKMCVCNEVGDGLPISEHQLKYSPMLFGRSNDSCTGLIQPALYTGKRLF
jgi:hypothetical protein